ncbi:unnamed protein product [Protopolystoma xenopodis]|uniref:Uncharacterized protein n=1 Tax=Protopolystoma xenopodis TaxID=117903 RepID=A0A448WKU5_9PLAT|nr:unnamed protein product [Protopolystoma xenopodis]
MLGAIRAPGHTQSGITTFCALFDIGISSTGGSNFTLWSRLHKNYSLLMHNHLFCSKEERCGDPPNPQERRLLHLPLLYMRPFAFFNMEATLRSHSEQRQSIFDILPFGLSML